MDRVSAETIYQALYVQTRGGLRRQRRRAAPDAGRLPGAPRPPVRLLHAGMVMAAASPDRRGTRPPTSRRCGSGLEGNLCRCTGYHNIVEAVLAARAEGAPHDASPRRPRRPPVVGTRMLRKEDPALLTGEARFADDLDIPGALRLGDGAQPVRPRPHHLDRRQRRRSRCPASSPPHRRRSRRRVGRPDAVRVAGHRRHEEPGAPPARHRQGLLRRRHRRRRRRRVATPRPRRGRRRRRRLRAAAARSSTSRTRWPTASSSTTSSARTRRYMWALHPDDGRGRRRLRRRHPRGEASATCSSGSSRWRWSPGRAPRCPQPFGGDITLYSATQIPHILKVMPAITLGIPEHKLRVVAPSVGGGFGSKLNVYAEELLVRGAGPQARPARCAGPRSAPRTRRPRSTAAARSRTSSWPPTPTASSRRPGPTCSPTWAPTSSSSRPASRCSARSSTTASTTSRPTSFTCTSVFTTLTPTDAYRGAGRPEATYAIERAMDALAARGRHRPGRDPPAQLHPPRPVPVHRGRRARLRLRRLRGRARRRPLELAGYDEPSAPSRPAARRRRHEAPRHRHLLLRRDVRAGAQPRAGLAQLLGRRLGVGDRARAADRQGAGRHRGRRRTARATRRAGR